MRIEKREGRKQKAAKAFLLLAAYCFLPSAFYSSQIRIPQSI